MLGQYAVGGQEWHRAGQPVRVRAHDRPEKSAQKVVSHGIYDLAADSGWVSVGCQGDTAAFTVTTLRRWWNDEGRHRYPAATRLLITADAGGANGYRVRALKQELTGFAHASGLQVCHFPPVWGQVLMSLWGTGSYAAAEMIGNGLPPELVRRQALEVAGRLAAPNRRQPRTTGRQVKYTDPVSI